MEFILEDTMDTENLILYLVYKVWENRKDEIDHLITCLAANRCEGIKQALDDVIDEILTKIHERIKWESYSYVESLGHLIRPYVICTMIYEAAYIGYPGGETYEQFLTRIFKKTDITVTDKELKGWVDRFKKFVSKQNLETGDFIRAINAYKINTVLKREDNSNTEKERAYYKAILPFQADAREYDLIVNPWNRSGNPDILSALYQFGLRRMFEDKSDYDELRTEYKRVMNTFIGDMEVEEIHTFLNFIEHKCFYIERYGNPLMKKMEQWALLKEIGYIDILNDTLFQDMNTNEIFFILGRMLCELIHRLNQEAQKPMSTLLWDELIQIANSFHNECLLWQAFRDTGIEEELQFKWKNMPRFSSENAKRCIEDTFLKPYLKQDQRLEDFLEIVLCYNYAPYDQDYLLKLANVFRKIFAFLQDCAREEKKINPNKRGERLSIYDLLQKLQSSLQPNMELSIGFMEVVFYINKPVRYFTYIHQNRYIYLEECISNAYRKHGIEQTVPIKDLAERFLSRVLNHFPEISYKKRAEVSSMILNRVVRLLYPNVWQEDTKKLYESKERVLDIAERYGFIGEIWPNKKNI